MNDKRQTVHLICNAHLDPVWLWRWEEGVAEAISTFRVAAEFCEAYEGFVFNHNEVILYQWVEQYEPQLFKRIQKLVKAGKWQIMGGWYLQPDCNMPSGESFVRHALVGREYFRKKFGVTPKVAINFDPFGHSRGIVQVLARSGYEGYLFCRPQEIDLPCEQFRWVGFDGSEVIGVRARDMYLSLRGTARKKVENAINAHGDFPVHHVLWGVGNHGGGPSRVDLEALNSLISETTDREILHSSADAFFEELNAASSDMPTHADDLNAWAVGCYTSMIRIKQKHRELENDLFMSEKMLATAADQGLLEYPHSELSEAQQDLLFSQFHDIIPGSCIQDAEEDALRMMGHGLEILSRLRTRAFFALASGQSTAKGEDIPVLVYNPHPFPVETTVECEFQLSDQNWTGTYVDFDVYHNGKVIPSQLENEASNIPIDWRKRMVFNAKLKPGAMNRFDCRPRILKRKPAIKVNARNGLLRFKNEEMELHINTRTGLIDRYRVNGKDILKPGAMRPLAIADDSDPWGMNVTRFRKIAGRFKPMKADECAVFCGVDAKKLAPVRVIEDGPARTVVEAMLAWNHSVICQHYIIPKVGSEFTVKMRVFCNEKDTMLKLAVPTIMSGGEFLGQTAYGVQALKANGDEVVSQKWLAVVDRDSNAALTCINDGTYGSDLAGGELRLSLLRSSGYAAHPVESRKTMPQDRFSPRIDQGERCYTFQFNAGNVTDRLTGVDREALVANEKPMALSFFPHGGGQEPQAGVRLTDKVVQIAAMKQAEDGKGLIVRLFEPTGRRRKTNLVVPWANMKHAVTLGGFEIKTLRIDTRKGKVVEVDLMENAIGQIV